MKSQSEMPIRFSVDQRKSALIERLSQDTYRKVDTAQNRPSVPGSRVVEDRLSQAQAQIEQLQSDNHYLSEELSKKSFENERLFNYVFGIEDEQRQVNSQLQTLEREKNELLMEHSMISRKYDELQQHYQESLKHFDVYETQLQEAQNQIRGYQKMQLQKTTEMSEISSDHSVISAGDIRMDMDAFEKEKRSLHKKLAEKNKVMMEQSAQINKMSEYQEKLHQSIMAMKEEARKSRDYIQQLKVENENLKRLQEQQIECLKTQENDDSNDKINGVKQEPDHLAMLLSPQHTNTHKYYPQSNNGHTHQQSNGSGIQLSNNNRQTNFNTYKDFDVSSPQINHYAKVCSSRLLNRPESSNTLQSGLSSQNKQKLMGDFKRMTSMAVGVMSNMLDYQSLQNGSRQASQLINNTKLDMSQAISRKHRPNVDDFKDNN